MNKLAKSILTTAVITAIAVFLSLTNPDRSAAQGPPGGGGAPVVVMNTPLPTVVAGWRPYEKRCLFNLHDTDIADSCTMTTASDMGTDGPLVVEYVSVACSQSTGATPQSIWSRVGKNGPSATGVYHFIAPGSPSVGGIAITGQQFRLSVETGNNVVVTAARFPTDGTMGCEASISGHIVTAP